MTTTININGKPIPVDDAFNDLTPEQQEMEKEYIAQQLAKGVTFGGGEPVAEKEPTTIAGLPVAVAPQAGAAIGATMGAMAGPAVGEVMDKGIATGANAIRPTPGNPSGNAPQSVRNWLASQTSTPYAGGRDYEEASRKANIAGSKPVQSRGSNAPIRRGGLGIDVQPPPATLPQKAAANILNAERAPKPGITRRVAGMGVAGAELGNMAKEFDEGNYGRALLSGVGTAGGVMSQSRIKPVRALGTGLSVAVPAIQKFLLKDKDEDQSNIQEKAMGGSVTPSPKLKSLSDFLDQLMQQAAAPAPAAAPATPPQGGLPPGMPGMPPQQPPGMPPQQPPMQQSPLSAMMPQMQAGGRVGGGLELAKKLFDRRFDKRVGEVPKLESQVRHVEPTHNVDVPKVYLPDYEGHPFVTSMSDRTDANQRLLGINNTMFNTPIDLTGGQGFMFAPRNTGKVWESGKGPSSAIVQTARTAKDFSGKDPIYLPWRMAPTGSDFSPMTGETMLAHAQSVMGKKEKAAVDNLLKNYIPNWKGLDNPESFQQFGSAPTKARKAAQNAMDKHFRNEGGLGLGEARLAISDPTQINAPEGGLQNVGRIFSDQSIIRSGEGSRYPYGVPGEGLGVVDRDINIAQLLPKWAKERGIEDATKPRATDMRSLQMKPYSGTLTDEILRSLGYKKGGLV
jgi:hypothetical protein